MVHRSNGANAPAVCGRMRRGWLVAGLAAAVPCELWVLFLFACMRADSFRSSRGSLEQCASRPPTSPITAVRKHRRRGRLVGSVWRRDCCRFFFPIDSSFICGWLQFDETQLLGTLWPAATRSHADEQTMEVDPWSTRLRFGRRARCAAALLQWLLQKHPLMQSAGARGVGRRRVYEDQVTFRPDAWQRKQSRDSERTETETETETG